VHLRLLLLASAHFPGRVTIGHHGLIDIAQASLLERGERSLAWASIGLFQLDL
jgi:hypothetical protein